MEIFTPGKITRLLLKSRKNRDIAIGNSELEESGYFVGIASSPQEKMNICVQLKILPCDKRLAGNDLTGNRWSMGRFVFSPVAKTGANTKVR